MLKPSKDGRRTLNGCYSPLDYVSRIPTQIRQPANSVQNSNPTGSARFSVRRGALAQSTRQLGQPDARIDLVKQRIAKIGHIPNPRSTLDLRDFSSRHSLLGTFFFSAHLFCYNPGEHSPAFGLQQGFRVEAPKKIQEGSDQTCPSRLVAGAEPRAVVTVEVLMK